MQTCTVHLTSITPYSQSKKFESDRGEKESADALDIRCWREKATLNDEGFVCLPAMGLKMAIDEAVKRLSISIPEKGKATYTKLFLAGQICSDVPGPCIGIHRDDMEFIEIWANSTGIRGGGTRVKRRFPYFQKWSTVATFHVLDESIPNAIFERALIEAGRLVGIGRFRPEKGGVLGRFTASNFKWTEL